MITKPRTVLVLVGIFIAGLASGVFLAPAVGPLFRPKAKMPVPRPSFAERNMGRLEEVLSLTPEQRVKIEALMRQAGDELAKNRRESWRVAGEHLRRLNEQIAELLSAEQRVKFEEFKREQEEKIRQRTADPEPRGPKHGGYPPHRPPPPPSP